MVVLEEWFENFDTDTTSSLELLVSSFCPRDVNKDPIPDYRREIPLLGDEDGDLSSPRG